MEKLLTELVRFATVGGDGQQHKNNLVAILNEFMANGYFRICDDPTCAHIEVSEKELIALLQPYMIYVSSRGHRSISARNFAISMKTMITFAQMWTFFSASSRRMVVEYGKIILDGIARTREKHVAIIAGLPQPIYEEIIDHIC